MERIQQAAGTAQTEKGKTMMDRDRELHEMADEGRALMSDYIKRDIERIIANAQECDIDALTWEEQKERLKAVKSVDVAPVRHGHWIKISPAGIYECSECGKNVMTSDIEAYEYCHGCGAIMDEEK